VIIGGVPCLLNIMFRMLEIRDLAKATGLDGEEKSYKLHVNKGEGTKQTGVVFPLHLAATLVRTNLAPQL